MLLAIAYDTGAHAPERCVHCPVSTMFPVSSSLAWWTYPRTTRHTVACSVSSGAWSRAWCLAIPSSTLAMHVVRVRSCRGRRVANFVALRASPSAHTHARASIHAFCTSHDAFPSLSSTSRRRGAPTKRGEVHVHEGWAAWRRETRRTDVGASRGGTRHVRRTYVAHARGVVARTYVRVLRHSDGGSAW